MIEFPEGHEGDVRFFQGRKYIYTRGRWLKTLDELSSSKLDLGPNPVWPRFEYEKVD
jgi:hypothetical protein